MRKSIFERSSRGLAGAASGKRERSVRSGAAGPASPLRRPTRADGCARTRPPRSNRPQAHWRSLQAARPRLPSAATPDNSSRPRAERASRRHPTSRRRAASISRSLTSSTTSTLLLAFRIGRASTIARRASRESFQQTKARVSFSPRAPAGAMRTGRPARIRRSPTSNSAEGRNIGSPISAWATIKSTPRASSAICWEGGPAIICGRHWRSFTIDKAERNSASTVAARSRNFSRSRPRGSPGPNRHDGGMRRGLPCDDADDGGGKALRHVGDDQEQLGVRPVHSHAGHQDGNRRQTSLRRPNRSQARPPIRTGSAYRPSASLLRANLPKHSDWNANSKACQASRGRFSPIGPQNPDRPRPAILERSAGNGSRICHRPDETPRPIK